MSAVAGVDGNNNEDLVGEIEKLGGAWISLPGTMVERRRYSPFQVLSRNRPMLGCRLIGSGSGVAEKL